ncbi:MAG: RagB/SusD family nutrient uptake outer membrane protein, partial [Parabacteroides sp.]|nr:RagB/SusD family nutrient uptake outer membrane protein [Parabacteroides sp.]
MKNRIKLGLFMGAVLFATSCSLDQDPISDFSEITVGGKDTTDTSVKFKTKEEMKTQYDGIYKAIQNAQEAWYADMLVLNETHSDNAYCGSSGAELTSLEQQTQDGTNKNIERDWNAFLGYINTANRVINNVDLVPDQSLTQAERKQWKAEAKIWRAWILFDMVRLWGDVPVVTEEAPDIT